MSNAAVLLAVLLPGLALGVVLLRGFRPWPLVGALLKRYRWINVVFVLLIAVATSMGIGVTAVERAVREGTARAADKFDLVIGAPGSELTLLFASVFAEPSDVGLVGGQDFVAVAESAGVEFAAPLGFGDSHEGAPIIGTTMELVEHMSGGVLLEGRGFEQPFDVIAGALNPIEIGARFEPAHGFGESAEEGLHGDTLTVVGRLSVTGAPWDHALLTPIEGVWLTHGLAAGHAPGNDWLGPPFDARFFPGTPAIVVKPESLSAAYALRARFDAEEALMAIFPGTELANLYSILGDARAAMGALVTITQVIIVIGVLTALFVLTKLFARQIELLSILGAPVRFQLAVIWAYAAALLTAGTVLGVALGYLAARTFAALATAQTNTLITARLGWEEAHAAGIFLSIVLLLSLASSAIGLRAAAR
ncbi:MAG: ABC transporter permease [Pseudomonadota bacterium]